LEALALEQHYGARNYLPLPVVLRQGEGAWLTDTTGRRYLDLMSAYSAVSLGHVHPRVTDAAIRQLRQVGVISRAFYSEPLGPFLKRLCEIAGFERALPMNTGAEAVETAIKAARRWGYRVKGIAADAAQIVVAGNNFHGRTTTIVGFSSDAAYRADFGPFAPGFVEAGFGDIESFRAAMTPATCAVLIEPIQGEAGIVVPPEGFLRQLRALCDEYRVLLIADEIQSGLGRTGKWFACQHEDVQPDCMVVGKALGGGVMPVSAFLASAEVMDLFEPGSHGSTFGGNPVAAAIGLEALAVIEEEGLIENSAVLGEHLRKRLSALHSSLIRDVRGRGLWMALELNIDARPTCEALMTRGVLAKETHGTVLRIAPPLCISQADLDWGLDQIECVLAEAVENA
jgi:ornithine--oxo-acid transaminase